MKIIGPFAQVVPMRNMSLKGSFEDDNLEVISKGGLLVSKGRVVAVDLFEDLIKEFPEATIEENNEETQTSSVIPGFVDAHTHICFAGNRARDYGLRVAGKTYLEIAKAGGGIWDSVTQTRAASLEVLTASTAERANRLLKGGVTTIEVKSGYGLELESELTMLKAILNAQDYTPAELISTCLSAHMKPRDFSGSDRQYLEMVINEWLPIMKEDQLTNRVDIFVEDSAFNLTDGRWFLDQAKALGYDLTIHADQFTAGGSLLAVATGAVSADHLEASTEKEIEVLAKSETVAVVLPGASIGLGMAFAPARKLLDAGACVAIASDWNPGSAPMGDLLTQAAIMGAYEKLTISETLAGLTYRAAAALGLHDRGRLERNQLADFQAYPTSDYRDIFYHQGSLKPIQVWKNGKAR